MNKKEGINQVKQIFDLDIQISDDFPQKGTLISNNRWRNLWVLTIAVDIRNSKELMNDYKHSTNFAKTVKSLLDIVVKILDEYNFKYIQIQGDGLIACRKSFGQNSKTSEESINAIIKLNSFINYVWKPLIKEEYHKDVMAGITLSLNEEKIILLGKNKEPYSDLAFLGGSVYEANELVKFANKNNITSPLISSLFEQNNKKILQSYKQKEWLTFHNSNEIGMYLKFDVIFTEW